MSPVLEGVGLAASRGPRRVIDGVTVRLQEGEVVGLVGANGSGKSTLLRALLGLLELEAGHIRLLGRPLESWPHQTRARQVAFLPQERECHVALRARDVVALGRLPHVPAWQSLTQQDWRAVEDAMAAAGVTHLADEVVTALSGGEQARVLLARALCTQARVLLADEPAAGLDPRFQIHLMRSLREAASNGAAVLVTLHDLALASRFCDRLLLLHEGTTVAEGPPRAVLCPDSLARAYGIEAQYFTTAGTSVVVPWKEVAR
jgi:iron complex transport system ATP-binding protein